MESAAAEAAAASTPEAAAVETTAPEPAATIAAVPVARTPIDPATPAVPASVIAAAVVAAAIIRRPVIPSGIKRTAVTDARVDGRLVTTRERNREDRNDCAQKNPTANHGFSPYLTSPSLLCACRGDRQSIVHRTLIKSC
jgi:hypothetical protein